MNAERLLAYYEQVADAPNAVAQLRRFILDLAVRGKLTPQNLEERPLRTTHNQLDRPQPFKTPRNWEWLRIGDQLDLLNGMAFKPTDWTKSGLRIVRIQNLNNRDAPFNFCDPRQAREKSLIDSGSLLISWSGTPGTSFGAFIWDRGSAVLNQHIFRCDLKTDAFSVSFLRIAINGRLDEMIAKAHGGVGLQHITKGKLEELLIPLPPLAEQHRISAKVDELMSLCDRLEVARAGREATRDKLAVSSLVRLNAPKTVEPHTSASASNPLPNVPGRSATSATASSSMQYTGGTVVGHARFVLDVLPALTARPDQVKALRQAVLSLAVRGKLVPQHAADESAIKLLDRLKRAHVDACKKEGIRTRPPINKIDRQGIWFDFPLSWAITSFDDIFVIVSGATKGQKISVNEAIDLPYLRVANVQRGYLDLSVIKNITVKATDQERYALRQGDILMTEGGDWDKLGRAAVWNEEIHNCIHQNHVFRARPPSKDILSAWTVMYVNSLIGRSYFEDASKQTTNLASINMTQLRGCPLPLPPIAEQHRIVAKVDELMALCDKLEASLTTATDTRRRLLDALLAEALDPGEDRLLEAAE